MKLRLNMITKGIVLLVLFTSNHACGQTFSMPHTIQLGASLEVLKPLLAEACQRTEKRHYTGKMAAPFHDQVQIDCFGLEVYGSPRKAEFMFNDGPLGHVWILVEAGEVDDLREALEKAFGPVTYETDLDYVFTSGTVALRLNPPEILVATPDLIAELTGYPGGEALEP